MLRLALASGVEVGVADELEMVDFDVSSDFFSLDPQPASARPSTTAMMAMPPALTLLIGSPLSVEICAMSLRSANARWKEKTPQLHLATTRRPGRLLSALGRGSELCGVVRSAKSVSICLPTRTRVVQDARVLQVARSAGVATSS